MSADDGLRAGNVVVIASAPPVCSQSLRPLTIPELLDQPAPRWIIRGILPESAFGVIWGAPGSGKTFLALDLAAAIARGASPWFGRRVRIGGVVYVASEGHLARRLAAYLEHNGIEPAALDHMRVAPARVNLLSPATGDLDTLIAEIKQAADEMGGVVLVILDTLNAMMPNGDENGAEDMGAMIAAARRIMAACDCAALYVHHSGKDESRGSRGHSSLKAAVDLELQVTGQEGPRIAEVLKVRDGEQGQRFGFHLEPVDLGPDPDPEAQEGERINSCAVVPLDQATPKAKPNPKRRDVALDALRETISEFGDRLPGTSTIPPSVKAVTLDQWRARWVLRTGYEKPESARVNFDKDRRTLLRDGKIAISKPYVWIE